MRPGIAIIGAAGTKTHEGEGAAEELLSNSLRLRRRSPADGNCQWLSQRSVYHFAAQSLLVLQRSLLLGTSTYIGLSR